MLTIPSTYLLAISCDIPRGQLARFIETHDARSQVSLMADPPSPAPGEDAPTASSPHKSKTRNVESSLVCDEQCRRDVTLAAFGSEADSTKPAIGTTVARDDAPIRVMTRSNAAAYLAGVDDGYPKGQLDRFRRCRLHVHELARSWAASDPTKRESTIAREELTLRLHVLPTMGNHRIDRVGPDDVQHLVDEWAIGHAPRTVKRNYEVVRAMFGYAVRNDWLARTHVAT